MLAAVYLVKLPAPRLPYRKLQGSSEGSTQLRKRLELHSSSLLGFNRSHRGVVAYWSMGSRSTCRIRTL